jgi:hypothetical protein
MTDTYDAERGGISDMSDLPPRKGVALADRGGISDMSDLPPRKVHDTRCGTCGRTWSSLDTPTPAARCPYEYDHDYREVNDEYACEHDEYACEHDEYACEHDGKLAGREACLANVSTTRSYDPDRTPYKDGFDDGFVAGYWLAKNGRSTDG